MNEVTVDELFERAYREKVQIIDVREPMEYANGRVPKSRLIPLGQIESRLEEIDQEEAIFVICRSGNRSSEAHSKLLALGFEDVTNVKGGFVSWRQNSYPFEKDLDAPWDIERQVRLVAGLLILIGFVLSVLVHPYLIGVSVFIGVGLTFSALTNTCTMGMILMKMPWNRVPVETLSDTV